MFQLPQFFVTRVDNEASVQVLECLTIWLKDSEFLAKCRACGVSCPLDLKCSQLVSDGKIWANCHEGVVVLFDHPQVKGYFSPILPNSFEIPDWARAAQWAVGVHPDIRESGIRTCARQVAADFIRNYQKRIQVGEYPWGRAKTTTQDKARCQRKLQQLELSR